MNINYIKNSLTLWKSADCRYSFNDLKKIANGFFNKTIIIICSNGTNLWRLDLDFNYKNGNFVKITWYGTIEKSNQCVDERLMTDIQFDSLIYNIIETPVFPVEINSEDNFYKNMKWCFMADLYQFIINSSNI